MIRIRHQILLNILKLFDQFVMVFSFALASWIVYQQFETISIEKYLSMRIKTQNLAIFIFFLLAWYYIFSKLVSYHSRRLSTLWSETMDIIKAASLGTFVLWSLALIFKIGIISPMFLSIFWLSSSVITILSRLMLRYMLSSIRLRGRNLRHILFVGTNQRAIQFAEKIESKKELGYKIVGFVDNEWAGIEDFSNTGYPLLTDFKKLASFIKWNVVDEIMICLPIKSFYNEISRIVSLCEEQGIIARFIPSIFDFQFARSRMEPFEGEYVITFFRQMFHWQLLIKRILDFSISLILLFTFLPLLVIIPILIKVNSPGPVFFIQKRIGKNKRRFNLYKFRTMVKDAEKNQSKLEHLNEVSGPVFKIKNDPRITSIGKILRKTSMDELPQLINVLKGDMSLVGPRPLPVRDYSGFDKDWYCRRLSVWPGITCLWQVNGRCNISFEKWMELDKEYIDNWSLWLDLKILAKTIPAVILGLGAA